MGGSPVPLTRLNEGILARSSLSRLEDFWVDSTDRARVHSFLLKPPEFDASKKYPVLFLIHGGPQGAWGESWSYRWNPQVFAAAGFVVVMPNPRGSTGYGQKFTDEVSGDWGGRVYEDVMAVTDYVAAQPWADGGRLAVAGGSYGGYMVNWLLGHTERFKAFVSHAGVYDLPSMGGETEELGFTKWEFGGLPRQNLETYAKGRLRNLPLGSKHRRSSSTASRTSEFRMDRAAVVHGAEDESRAVCCASRRGSLILKPRNSFVVQNIPGLGAEWTRPTGR
jgi:dipeptidyl aminopeptidase/acylaminoacyl peptidase